MALTTRAIISRSTFRRVGVPVITSRYSSWCVRSPSGWSEWILRIESTRSYSGSTIVSYSSCSRPEASGSSTISIQAIWYLLARDGSGGAKCTGLQAEQGRDQHEGELLPQAGEGAEQRGARRHERRVPQEQLALGLAPA